METRKQANVKRCEGYDLRVSDDRKDSSARRPEPSEADEREAFERRAEWWRLHYGKDATDADENIREAAELTERPPEDDP
jgi:hypothetical protein